MAELLGKMTAEVQALYDADAKKHPWLKNITMSDDELRERIDYYTRKGMTVKLFEQKFKRHYNWVYLAQIKHFLTTGEVVCYDYDYVDAESELVICDIRTADGASEETIDAVMEGEKKYKFRGTQKN